MPGDIGGIGAPSGLPPYAGSLFDRLAIAAPAPATTAAYPWGGIDSFMAGNWMLANRYQVEPAAPPEPIGAGQVFAQAQFHNLVQAMAGFSPPAVGQVGLPQRYQIDMPAAIAVDR